MYVKESKCSSCSHYPICSIKEEYLRLVESIPKQVNSNFKVNVDCNFFTASYNSLYSTTIKVTSTDVSQIDGILYNNATTGKTIAHDTIGGRN